jgi:glycosyltransferase involved in cell wall biosynthesis
VTGVDGSVGTFLSETVGIRSRQVQVIRNGVDVPRFANAAADRESLGLGSGRPVIGVVARLHPVKGHSVLLHAFVGVKSRFPNAELLIVGDGEERASLTELAKELRIAPSVVFLGSRRDIPELLATMDVVVLPSLEEGLPLSLLEAMAAAKPIVATDVGAVSTVIRNNETGLLVPPNDAGAITEAIVRMLSDTELQRVLATAAQGLAVGQYSIDRTAEAYDRIYASLCRPSD